MEINDVLSHEEKRIINFDLVDYGSLSRGQDLLVIFISVSWKTERRVNYCIVFPEHSRHFLLKSWNYMCTIFFPSFFFWGGGASLLLALIL